MLNRCEQTCEFVAKASRETGSGSGQVVRRRCLHRVVWHHNRVGICTNGFDSTTTIRSMKLLLATPGKAHPVRTSAVPYLKRSYSGPALAAVDAIYA